MIFDGPNKVIVLEAADTQTVSVIDVYSNWKLWVTQGNAQYARAMSSVGGDPITGILSLGSTFFLENGWKIRPREADQELEIAGNLYSRDGTNPLTQTTGTYRVLVTTRVSNLVDTVTTGGSSLTAADVWDLASTGHTISGTFGALVQSASQGPAPIIDTSAISNAVWSRDLTPYVAGTAAHVVTSTSSSLSTVASDMSFVKSIQGGRWKIDNNKMLFYDDDNVTLIAEFNLYDSTGTPSETSVFERVRV